MGQEISPNDSRFAAGCMEEWGMRWLHGFLTFLSMFTLFIAYPWVACWYQRWLTRNHIIDGRALAYDGKGGQLLGNYLKWMGLSIITLGIYAIFCMPQRMLAWQTSHTHVSGVATENGDTPNQSKFTGKALSLWIRSVAVGLGSFFTLFIAYPWLSCWMQRWTCEHTVIDRRSLVFDGKGGALFGSYIKWFLLSIITLSIYANFCLPQRIIAWKVKNMHVGDVVVA